MSVLQSTLPAYASTVSLFSSLSLYREQPKHGQMPKDSFLHRRKSRKTPKLIFAEMVITNAYNGYFHLSMFQGKISSYPEHMKNDEPV